MAADDSGAKKQGGSDTKAVEEPGMKPAIGDMSELLGSASERIQEVLEATDATAKSILDKAKDEARQYKQEAGKRIERVTKERTAKMSEAVAGVVEHTEALQQRARELAETMEKSSKVLKEELGITEEVAEAAAPSETDTEVETTEGKAEPTPVIAGQDGKAEAAAGEGDSPAKVRRLGFKRKRTRFVERDEDGDARLRALQMLVAGTNREEIEARLKEEFAIEDPSKVLDALVEVQPLNR